MKLKFSQKVQDVLYSVADDEILTMAIADYLDKRAENAIQVMDDITNALAGGDVKPEYHGHVLFNDIEQDTIRSVSTDELIESAKREPVINPGTGEAEILFTDTDGVTHKLDTYVEQTGESINSIRVISESLRLAYNAKNQEFAENSANFKARLEMRMGTLSDNAASLGYKINQVLCDSKISVRAKLSQILKFLGKQPIEDKDSPIGIPTTDFSEYYESNVWCAWGVDLVDRSANFFEGCWNIVKDVFSVLGDIASSALGGLFNKVGDVILTTLGFTDSFRPSDNYSDLSFSDFSYCGVLDFSYLNPHNNPLIENTPILTLVNNLIGIIHGNDDPSGEGLDRNVLYDAVKYWFFTFNNDNVDWENLNPDDTILGGLKGVYQMYQINVLGINYTQVDDLSDVNSYRDVIRIIYNTYLGRYFSGQSLLNEHLSAYTYVKLCLPYGYMYLWKDENADKVYIKVYTVPVKSVPFSVSEAMAKFNLTKLGQDDDDFGDMLFNVGIKNYANGVTQMSDWYDWAARDAIMNAHLVNSIFLTWLSVALGLRSYTDVGSIYTISDFASFLTAASVLELDMYGEYAFNPDDSIANQVWATYNLGNTDATINNLKLAKYLGAVSTGPKLISGTVLLNCLDIITHTMFDDGYWNFYVHTSDTPHGLWHVMSSAELVGYVNKVIVALAVVYTSVKLVKLMKRLKRASYIAQGKADLVLFSAMNEDTGAIDDSIIDNAFKLQKKANLIELVRVVLFGSIKSSIGMLGSTLVSIPGSIYRSVRNAITSKTDAQTDVMTDDVAHNCGILYRVMTGRDPV